MRRAATGFLRETYEGTESAIDLPFIGCELSLSDIYERIEIYEGIEFTAACVRAPEQDYELTNN